MAVPIDPFKHLGPVSSWGAFGSGADDEACDAERRAMVDHFVRRIRKAEKRGSKDAIPDVLAGGMTAFAGLFIVSAGGVDALKEDHFEKFISIATFAWYQAISCLDGGAVQ